MASSSHYQPVYLNLRGKQVVVIGGGYVAVVPCCPLVLV